MFLLPETKFILRLPMENTNICKVPLWRVLVAGAAAVLMAYMPNLTPAQVIQSLKNSVNKSTANDFGKYSEASGVIDVYKAAQNAYTHFNTIKTVKPTVKTKKVVKKK